MEIKLSIAIPTYNGVQAIRETLDSIVSQLEEGVEIVVSDNASTDGTAEIIREYQAMYPLIRYFCNDENVGADRNFDLAVRRAKGEYVWLFSDDDKIAAGGIRKVMSVLQAHSDLAVVFINYAVYSSDLRKCLKERVLEKKNDLYCENADRFLAVVKIAPVFVSSNVIRRALWEQTNSEFYIGTNWIHYGTMLSLLPGHPSYYVSFPYVLLRSGGLRWKRDGIQLIYGCELIKIIRECPKLGYSTHSTREALNVMLHSLPMTIIGCKLEGLSVTRLLLGKIVKHYAHYPSFWIRDLALLLLPSIFYKLVWELYKIPLLRNFYKRSKFLIQHKWIRKQL
ncbi:MAG: glycosyltransferase [Firmicutes bacterium]|nr:glycosyltransferase family 2 protein [Dethiobacter sp.]MCL4462313.1 glycosyltransferase [Bacillota bacterium]MCL5993925.1 glycosyltransferase [Bacillota bacterium]